MTKDRYTDAVSVFVGWLNNATIKNSYSTGTIDLSNVSNNGHRGIGGLVGVPHYNAKVENSYSSVTIKAPNAYGVGGLMGGWSFQSPKLAVIKGSYATGDVTCREQCGGLVGQGEGIDISDSHATGNVVASGNYVGGLVGRSTNTSAIENCYATGNVESKLSYVGGFVGPMGSGSIKNSYATGSVKGAAYVGGFGGNITGVTIENVYASGDVTSSVNVAACQGGTNTCTGGAFGQVEGNSKVTGVYAKGTVKGGGYVGGLIGRLSGSTIENAAAFGSATCLTFGTATGIRAGGLVGCAVDGWSITNALATGDAKGSDEVGAVIGGAHRANNTLRNVYGTGHVSGNSPGALVGYFNNSGTFAIKNSYYWTESGDKIVSIGTPAETSAYPFKYNDNKEAVLTSNEKRKLNDALGTDWINVQCKLSTGPNDTVTIPVHKSLGADICK
jgi:hypothetical protein